ncbi:hypothetical protein [Winogradskyella aurantia]|uniref:Uncharacterized protein n=1 Tax=Winogradskyella aurantia TaxID=1915063 RepID=A0A265UWR2_9FLAO|nr:hypothetical protein [Winogradskyella aurantia]OZV69726.1 hypothetical protein CA834_03635 [Winogradskyella aurantia]
MNQDLRHIKGFKIETLPFELEKVGDLMYFDGSLMSVYKDINNNPFIFDWVDSNEEFNRWLVYQINSTSLNSYIIGESTHYNLLNNPLNSIVFVLDKDNENVIRNCQVCSPNNLPYDYLPHSGLKFEEDDSRNLELIIENFELDLTSAQIETKVFDILEEAKKSSEELINIHIKSTNRKVGYGKIYSSILGKALTNYTDLNKATALNIYDTKAKIPIEERPRRKKGELKSIKEMGELEFVYAKAASFSIFLRPITKQTELFDNQTSSEKITQTLFQLFDASKDLETLREFKTTLNEDMLNSYNSFLKEIKEDDIAINVQYANPINETVLIDTFNSTKANNILGNLNSLEFENVKEIKTKGVYKALDSIYSSFKFESFDGDIYSGKFSKQLKDGVHFLNLQDTYQVTIEVLETKKSGKKGIKEKDTIVSSVKVEE